MTDAPLGTAEEQLVRARKSLRAAEALTALSLFGRSGRRYRGSPSARSAMMLRWISFDPA